jgi:hypothetical protein
MKMVRSRNELNAYYCQRNNMQIYPRTLGFFLHSQSNLKTIATEIFYYDKVNYSKAQKLNTDFERNDFSLLK